MDDLSGEDRRRRKRWRLALFGVLASAVLVFAGQIFIIGDEPTATFCTADGVIGHPDAYRDHKQNCQWVDKDGRIIPELIGR